MADALIRLTNSAGKRIDLELVDSIDDNFSSENISLPSIGKGSDENNIFNLSGMNRQIGFSFKLIDTGVDKSNGDNVVTVQTQAWYLREVVFTGKIDETYTLTTLNNDLYDFDITCLINELRLNPNVSNPSYIRGNIRVIQGSNPLSLGGEL